MSILYQNSDLTQSKVYYSNKASVLHELSLTLFKAYCTFEEKFQTLQQISAFSLNTRLIKFFLFIKF